MSKRERRDSDHRGMDRDRRDGQPEEEQQHRLGGADAQEGDSLTALKAILVKVAGLLRPLQLNQEESTRLVEQLYGKVLETDLQLAGEADDTRKSSVLAAIQTATIRRDGDKIVVDYSRTEEPKAAESADSAEAAPSEPTPSEAAPSETAPSETAPMEEPPPTP